MGPDGHGHVRMFGNGPSQKDMFGQSSKTSNVDEGVHEEFEVYKSKVDNLQSKYEEISRLLQAHLEKCTCGKNPSVTEVCFFSNLT